MATSDERERTTEPAATRSASPDPGPETRDTIALGRRLAAAAAEPVVGAVSSVVSSAVTSAMSGLAELPARGVRKVRRTPPEPLPSLSELYPDARLATPVEVGLRAISVEDVRGTAVGGGDQRGIDFLPLPDSRSQNWEARWQRLKRAQKRLAMLPPIDVVKYDGAYWVIDGHNRVALANEVGQVSVDASIVELVPPGGRRTEPIVSLAASVEAFRAVRTRAGAGDRPGAIVQATVDTSGTPSAELMAAVESVEADE